MTVPAGGCSAVVLPADSSCAAVARRFFRAAAVGVGLAEDILYDGAVMASELAANSLHAREAIEAAWPGTAGAGHPEIWVYLRQEATGGQELVCKVFDALPGWGGGHPPDPSAPVPDDAVSGRGLRVLEGLSGGRWGHHLSRSRLGGWNMPGKAVWFALPVPRPMALDRFRRTPGSLQAARTLERMLRERGIGHIVRCEAAASSMSVLSIRRDLTVWCRSRVVSWTTRSGYRECRACYDLEDAAEGIVCAHEDLARADAADQAG